MLSVIANCGVMLSIINIGVNGYYVRGPGHNACLKTKIRVNMGNDFVEIGQS